MVFRISGTDIFGEFMKEGPLGAEVISNVLERVLEDEGQRMAVITFDSPRSAASFLAEHIAEGNIVLAPAEEEHLQEIQTGRARHCVFTVTFTPDANEGRGPSRLVAHLERVARSIRHCPSAGYLERRRSSSGRAPVRVARP